MIYTPKIKAAIRFAVKTHEVYQKQKRKGKDVAYIEHPLNVALILAMAGANEDLIVAGILHDTIEDSVLAKKVTKEMLTERFGQNVAELVNGVTEQDKSLPWEIRKERAFEQIQHFSHDLLLLKSADVVSNVWEMIDDYGRDGEVVWTRFNVPRDKNIEQKIRVIDGLCKYWPESPLVADLMAIKEKLYTIK